MSKKYFFITAVFLAVLMRPVYSQDKPNEHVEITAHSLGPKVNSSTNDFLPYITKDGLSLYFVSQRSLGKNQIFVSKRKSRNAEWEEPEFYKLLQYKDAVTGIAFDDSGRVYCSSNRNNRGDLNIWEGDSHGDKLTMLPEPVNTIKAEMEPSVTRDGKYLFFASNRASLKDAGNIHIDIYVTQRKPDGSWSEPEDLGPNINIGRYNLTPSISPDGRFLFFASKEEKKLNVKSKIYMSEHIGPKNTDWLPAVLLPPGINSEFDDSSPMVAPDGKTLYFASDRVSANRLDLYEATLPQNIQDKVAHSFPGY